MDVLSSYISTLEKLRERYDSLLCLPYTRRDHLRIKCIEDEIKDVEYVISLLSKDKSMYGYYPCRFDADSYLYLLECR